jgi:protein-disulfide isomerase
MPLVGAAAAWAQAPGGGKFRGTMMATVHMELFSDFQCPGCKQFHEQTLKQLMADYVDKNRVYLINREFPLPMHAYARPAAALAVAAGRIGKYERVADALFARQESWSKDGQYEAAALAVLTPAEAAKVKALAASADVKAVIDKDIELGKGKITSTPTSILTHKGRAYPVSGVVSYPIFRRFLDELLSK